MSGAINYIMARLCGRGSFDLPREILATVFKDDWLDREMPATLEDRILMNVVRPRVLRDINLIYGEQILIDLKGAEFITIGDLARIYRFAPEHTNNREIISAECVNFLPTGLHSNFQSAATLGQLSGGHNEIMGYASQVMSSVSSIPVVSTTRTEVVAYNTIRVTDRSRFRSSYSVRAWVTNDGNLSNIPPQAYDKLFKLCLHAVKAYCYNEYIVAMGDAFIQRGKELGIFKTIIESWSGEAEAYYTFKEEHWAVQGILMNEDQHNGFLTMMVGLGM